MYAHTAAAQADPSDASDQSLVDLAKNGNETAVRILVRRHNQRLYRVARAVVLNDAEAEDIVQETYVRAFTRLDRFRGEASLATWLTRIALNEALGRIRRRRPTVGLETMERQRTDVDTHVVMFPSTAAIPNPEAAMARRQVRELLEQALEALPELFRVVFILRDVEGLSIDETAAHLGIKPQTVKTRLHRARRLMRAALTERVASTLPDLFPFAGTRCEQMAERVIEGLRQAQEKDYE